MDIWKWVTELQEDLEKNGQERLASLIQVVPHYSVNDEHEQVDSFIPEALALTKQIRHPWLELYFRHWHLQSRILERYEGQSALGDAVHLVEFAHREETKGCPQAICSIQDLSSCYGIIDGCGYAEERLQVVKETLDKIDASWPCFHCLSSEYADALYDQNRHEEGIAFLENQLVQVRKVQKTESAYNFLSGKVNHLLELGKYQEALEILLKIEEEAQEDKGRHVTYKINKSCTLSYLKRYAEAKEILPPLEEIQKTPSHYGGWADAVHLLVQEGVYENTWTLGRALQGFVLRLAEQGAIRPALEIAETHAQLALSRGAFELTRLIISFMKSFVPKLYKPFDMPKRIEALEKKVETQSLENVSLELLNTSKELFNEEAFLQSLGEQVEQNLQRLAMLPVEIQTRSRIVLARSYALQTLGFAEEAESVLQNHLERTPNDYEVSYMLGYSFLGKANPQPLFDYTKKLERTQDQEHQAIASFLLGLYFHQQQDFRKSSESFTHVLTHKPESINAHLFLGRNAIQLAEWEAALSYLTKALELKAEPVGTYWLQLVAATMLGKWDLVREAAKQVGIEISGEGPIDENWGLCQIQFSKEPNMPTYYAIRTGPVTARIIQMAFPSVLQHYGDEVVFFASPLNAPPENSEENPVYLFEVAGMVKKRNYQTFDMDGVHPGEESIEALKEQLNQIGVALQVVSNEEYQIWLEAEDASEQTLLGIYALLAIPQEISLTQVSRILEEKNKSIPHPLIYVKLAQALQDEALVHQQFMLVEKYHLNLSSN